MAVLPDGESDDGATGELEQDLRRIQLLWMGKPTPPGPNVPPPGLKTEGLIWFQGLS